jgi:hypothetical protein
MEEWACQKKNLEEWAVCDNWPLICNLVDGKNWGDVATPNFSLQTLNAL